MSDMAGSTQASAAAKFEWIARVLGVEIPQTDPAIQDAIEYVTAALNTIIDGENVRQRLTQVRSLAAAGNVEALARAEALRDEVAASLSKARAGQAAVESRDAVRRAKLLLSVRRAHEIATANLHSMGVKLLSLPEVQEHPEFEEVRVAVKRLDTVIPELDKAVINALGRYDDAKTLEEQNAAARDAVAAVRVFRKKLRTHPLLSNIEDFAEADIGMQITKDLHAALADADSSLQHSL